MSRPDVLVIGGGVVGLATALQLSEAGCRVALLDRGEMGHSCSFGNAGLIPPSFCEPLATPSSLVNAIKGMFEPDTPFRLRLRGDRNWLRWILRFLQASQWTVAQAATQTLSRLCSESLGLYSEWAKRPGAFWLRQNGWLHLYATDRGLEIGLAQAERLRSAGVEPIHLRPNEARDLEPSVTSEIRGAIYFPKDAHLDPLVLTRVLALWATAAGAELRSGENVIGLRANGGRVSAVVTRAAEFSADSYVVCAGAWSGGLLRGLGVWIPVEPGQGYSLTFDESRTMPRLPLMLGDAHVVVTPMGRRVRMTSGLELVGFSSSPSERRWRTMRLAIKQSLPHLSPSGAGEPWLGLRPMTPDGLPIIGPLRRLPNLFLATGHGTLGVALAAVTGKLISDVVQTGEVPQALEPFHPRRFGA